MSNLRQKILVTGAAGSGGSYLLEHLISIKSDSYFFALARNESSLKNQNLKAIEKQINVEFCDLTDANIIMDLLKKISPDEIYHLASDADVETAEVAGPGFINVRLKPELFARVARAAQVEARQARVGEGGVETAANGVPQRADEPRPDEKTDEQRRQAGRGRAERDVARDVQHIERGVKRIEEAQQH